MPFYTVTGGKPVLVTRFTKTSSYDGGELALASPSGLSRSRSD
jgi:hypothetical protein